MRLCILIFCIWGALVCAPSQEIEPISQRARNFFEIQSPKILSYQDTKYKIFIAKTKADAKRYKVLFLLDGNALFSQYLNSYLDSPKQDLLVIGVGYEDNFAFNIPKRTKDYTPMVLGKEFEKGGGSLDFFNFFKRKLLPYIRQHYPINTSYQGIFGHSFGGLFVLWSLLQESGLFSHYFIVSPSLWWGEASFLPDNILIKKCPKIFLLKGSEERIRSKNPQTDMINFAERLEKESFCFPEIKIFINETHGSVIKKALDFTKKSF
ncbi:MULTISPECIES: alpha/beta hydrolase [unclassified Helicobacter]|uniref:alpha/beta hydrolase n=1 Tax=unclassified Helicobacter TaxID=2593540 RepID=UPI000CF1793C|nr:MULTISPECIES: alpha/beta hydrolase-fold protein [unclassified Helicobacter]